MTSTVYFADIRSRSRSENNATKIRRLFNAAGFGNLFRRGDLTAVKLHFGEYGNDGFISPTLVRAAVDMLREIGAKPFLTDTTPLFTGSRANAVDHLMTASAHGFIPSVVDAPVLIADGLKGDCSTEVPIEGNIFHSALIGEAVAGADALLAVSQVRGNELVGFSGTIKQLGMGCASPEGKRAQHSPRFEVDEASCVFCGECESVCPVGAASLTTGAAVINRDKCIGCGECVSYCPERCITMDFHADLPEFVRRMTEYALAPLVGKGGRTGFINFVTNVNPDGDSFPWNDSPIVPGIGFLASTDPVALDKASFDLVNAAAGIANTQLQAGFAPGEDKFRGMWPSTDARLQFQYAEEIGLGSTKYRLIKV